MLDDPAYALGLGVFIGAFAILFWWTRKSDKIQKRFKEQQERANEMQLRAIQILDREIAILDRAERLLDRIESKL